MTENVPSKPNEQLAALVAEELISQGLVPEAKRAELLRKLNSGTVKAEDWSLYVEMALANAEPEVPDAEAD